MPKPKRPSPPATQTMSTPALDRLLDIMARLRAPDGCPWDLKQNHRSLRFHAVEEVYELIDAIDAGNDADMEEELGDLLLQIVFHCQLAGERGAFDFNRVAQRLVDKLVHRHPHVFGDARARTAAAVLAQWDRLKQSEKQPAPDAPPSSVFDGIPRHLPALMQAQKLWKKANQTGLANPSETHLHDESGRPLTGARAKRAAREMLFALACLCQDQGWSAEDLLRQESGRRQRQWRKEERRVSPAPRKARAGTGPLR